MPTALAITPNVNIMFLDTTDDALDLSLANGGGRPNEPLHIIMIRGANTASLASADTLINLTAGAGHGAVTTITWNEVGDNLTLIWEAVSKKWNIISYYGVGFS
jgi:hypothetical protein